MPLSLPDAHVELQRRLRAALVRAVESIWKGLPGYDRENLDEWLSSVLPAVEGAQRQSIALTDQFLARSLEREPLGLSVVELSGPAVRNGTAPEEVYSRSFRHSWHELGEGKDWADAVREGMKLAGAQAATDVQLSMRGAANAVGEADPGVYGFERVTDGDACDLCLIASTQRYRIGHLLPIHDRCGCGVRPITDPNVGRVINKELYRKLKAEGTIDKLTRQRRAKRYRDRAQDNRERAGRWRAEADQEQDPKRRARLEKRADSYDDRAAQQLATADDVDAERTKSTVAAVEHHGELGPVLVNGNHRFKRL